MADVESPKPFFLDERFSITSEDFVEWKNVMLKWIESIPEYKQELENETKTPLGEHILMKIVTYCPKIPELKRRFKNFRHVNTDNVWSLIQEHIDKGSYKGNPDYKPEHHSCQMSSIHEIPIEKGLYNDNFCTSRNPCIMEMGPNLIHHYILHYIQMGAWNKEYPEPPEAEKHLYLSFTCKICGKIFTNSPQKNNYSARKMLILHIAYLGHRQILDVMKEDKKIDMSNVIAQIEQFWGKTLNKKNQALNKKNQHPVLPKEQKIMATNNYLKTKKAKRELYKSGKIVPYNRLYNFNLTTESLELRRFHTCIKCKQNSPQIEMDSKNCSLIEHYREHYRKQGEWDHIFPLKTEKQLEEYIQKYVFLHKRSSFQITQWVKAGLKEGFDGYSCIKCLYKGGDEFWSSFKTDNLEEMKSAKVAAIDHLTKHHGLLQDAMKRDKTQDMTTVIKLLGGVNEDQSEKEWLVLCTSPGKHLFKNTKTAKRSSSSQKDVSFKIGNLQTKRIKLVGVNDKQRDIKITKPIKVEKVIQTENEGHFENITSIAINENASNILDGIIKSTVKEEIEKDPLLEDTAEDNAFDSSDHSDVKEEVLQVEEGGDHVDIKEEVLKEEF